MWPKSSLTVTEHQTPLCVLNVYKLCNMLVPMQPCIRLQGECVSSSNSVSIMWRLSTLKWFGPQQFRTVLDFIVHKASNSTDENFHNIVLKEKSWADSFWENSESPFVSLLNRFLNGAKISENTNCVLKNLWSVSNDPP